MTTRTDRLAATKIETTVNLHHRDMKRTMTAKTSPQRTTTALDAQRAPLCIYVAWHTQSKDAEHLAREVFCWFRGDPRDLEACATGIPVLFRAWQPSASLPGPIDLPRASGGRIRVLVPLVDEHFVACKQWRHYVHRLVGRARRREDTIVFPVALHPGAFEIAGEVATLNFLRADGHDTPASETDDARRVRRTARILNQLTDALGRLLLAKNDGFDVHQFDKPPEKVSIFVSHAKADGAGIAGALRDEIQRHGQLDAFYDENDLAYGFDYHRGLERALIDGNALLLAVLSDQYASRPWCRRELRSMRGVHELRKPSPDAAGICKLLPVVVVDALEKRSIDYLPEIGPAPVFRWNEGCSATVVDRILRQVLQYAHDLQRSYDIAEQVGRQRRRSTWIVNGTPDLRIVAEARLLARQANVREMTLVFPGPGVTNDTCEDWHRLFPDVTFLRFDDIEVSP